MKKAYFIGICGVGMSATAILLKQKGWQVEGSDEGFYPPISDYLIKNHIKFHTKYEKNNVPDNPDMVVIGKHSTLTPEQNAEVKEVFAKKYHTLSYPEVLADIAKDTCNLVVVGSYGKSTCSTLAAYILAHSNLDPYYFLGALSDNFDENAHVGKDQIFVMEGDEYPSSNWDSDAKFLHLNARNVLVTGCEHDHYNVFPTIESYKKPFVQLLKTLPKSAVIVANFDEKNTTEVVKESDRQAIYYSLKNTDADYYGSGFSIGSQTRFDIHHHDQIIPITTSLLGEHNWLNIIGVAAWLLELKLASPEQISKAVATFKPLFRRLELKTAHPMPVYEDFGSSYAKATAGIKAVRDQYPDKRIVVIFEPHTFSFRNHGALEWYDRLFDFADLVFIYQPPTAGSETHDQLTQAQIVERVKSTGKKVISLKKSDNLSDQILPHLNSKKDVVLIESSGSLDGSIPKIISAINKLTK
ncbi:MAG: Mur ligase family protein [Patescibacteria group bacterium]